MKINKKLHSVALASAALIILLALVSSTVPAATAHNDSPVITETRITTSGSAQFPDIYGDKIVWEDYRSRNLDIYMYDLSTQKETQITTNETVECEAAIYGNRIVWTDQQGAYADWNLYMYDLSTHNITQITTNEQAQEPDIYGDRIVWDEQDGFQQIHMYNLSTHQEIQITTDESDNYNSKIYGDKIVWTDIGDGGTISMYDILTSKKTQIATDVFKSGVPEPDIYKNRIVWDNGDVYVYDISTKKETQIPTDRSTYSPRIYDDRIVYMIDENLHMYNLSSSQDIQITTSGSAGSCAVYGDRIVFQDNRNGNWDIYMCTLGSNIPVANFSARPISGKSPLTVTFTDKSTGTPAKWKWSFGDGTTSTQQNPKHKYSKAGKYTVSLTIKNAADSNTVTKTNYITVIAKPVASFSAKPTSGKAPLTVAFNDSSTGSPTKWKWSFGDGKTSTQQNPTHKYSKAGTYTVKLTSTNVAGSNTATKTNYIKVIAKPVAAFSASPTSGRAPLNVKFTDKSTGSPTKWKWIFGDGTSSTKQNLTHKYTAAGKYTVSLTVTNAAGSNTKTVSNYITVKK